MNCLSNARFVRLILCVLGAELVPLATLTVYIELTRNLPYTTTPDGLDSDWPALLACIGMGAACFLALPCRWWLRILVAIASIPAFFFALAFYWLP